MTPKEKAIYLYLMFKQRTYYVEVFHTIKLLDKFHNNAKQCALIAVDEMINILIMVFDNDDTKKESYDFMDKRIKYLEEVKKEIEAL